jgi:hypothetical protein
MYRLFYIAPFIVATVNTFGYFQIQISATTLLIVAISLFSVLDVRRALQQGRMSFRLNNSVVFLAISLLFISASAAATVAANSSNYQTPGALYVAITPYLMLFPCVWIVVTHRIDKASLIKLLGMTLRVVLAADLVA